MLCVTCVAVKRCVAAAREGGAAGEGEPGTQGRSDGAHRAGDVCICMLACCLLFLIAVIHRFCACLLACVHQLNAIVEEKSTLERNISSLYNTAKLEIDRKAREIQQLREELAIAQATVERSSSSVLR